MITIEYYQCEICKTLYDNTTKATNCEDSHADKAKLEVADSKYKDFQLWPDVITVQEKKTDTFALYKLDKSSI